MTEARVCKLVIQYDGSQYSGWQRQDNAITIQQKIEEALAEIFQQKITLHGSGRTDAGVHAIAQVASFSFDGSSNRGIARAGRRLLWRDIREALNSILPSDIVITGCRGMPADFHARHSAKGKRYRYVILNRPYRSAFFQKRCWFSREKIEAAPMRQAAKIIRGRHSFRAFSSESHREKSYVRNLSRLAIHKDGPWYSFTFEADGFLYNMIRIIVGTLVEIGRGKFEPRGVAEIIKSENRSLAGPTAPPRGLYLEKVFY